MKKAELALAKSQEQYRETIELAVDGILQGNPDGVIIAANSQMQKLAGRSLNELLGLHVSMLFDPRELRDNPLQFDQLNSGQTVINQRHLLRPDGSVLLVEMHSKKMPNGTYQSIYRDVTERKQFESALDGFIRTVSSLAGKEMFCAFAEQIAEQLGADMVMIGRSLPAQEQPNAIQTLAVFKDGAVVEDFIYSYVGTPCERTMAEKATFCVVCDNVASEFPQDSMLAVQGFNGYVGIPLRDVSGAALGLICSLFRRPPANLNVVERILKIFANQAVMELQRMDGQRELAHSEYRFRAMFAQMRSAVAVYSAVDNGQDFVFTDFNPAAESIDKISKEQVLGRRITEVFPAIREFGLLAVMANVWRTGVSAHHPVQLYKDSRIAGWRETYIYKLPTGELVTLYDDVTERVLAQQAREKLLDEIQTKNNELETIVFVASHDLRSPLINIQGFAGELDNSCHQLTALLGRETLTQTRDIRRLLDEEIPESLRFISAGASKMDSLVRGLLQIARIGTVQLHIEPLDMNRMLAIILNTVQYQMREFGVEIQVGNLPGCLADWAQLNQAFSNLIDNAIKYRHPKRKSIIHIDGQILDGRAIYTVRDNGIGIAPEHTDKIFEIFHRLNPAGPIKGEGLGLTIVRRTLDRMNGKINVKAELDQGATFIIDLPAA